ncbi:uncharacterized protein LOC143047449 [Mytilus galloprovincialis]|uniref:uncharacterized protein LOC143047449 n=1 Tax=Mytilus galloprovincialis TaxID=29158 RepID=UPI003F7C79E8
MFTQTYFYYILFLSCVRVVDGNCDRDTGPSGVTECFLDSSYYKEYQWGTCITNVYMQEKSGGKYHCRDSTRTYCYYQCMLELHDVESGPVYDDCKCENGQEYTESNLTLPSRCYSPSGADCSWYRDCLERKFKCSGTEDDYAMAFATKFCDLYSQNYQDFSQDGQQWIDAVRKCLQVSLVQSLRPYLPFTCEDVKRIAFDSHTPCYVKPIPESPSISVCNLDASDYFSVFWTIQSSLKTSTNSSLRTIRSMFETLKQCTVSFLPSFSFDGPVRLVKLKLKYFFILGRRRRPNSDDKMKILNDFVDSMAYKLHWQENGVLWFSDPEINSNNSASSETYIDVFLTNRNVYDLDAKNTRVPSNLNTTVNKFKKMTQTGDLNGNIGGFSIKILTSQGCLDASCDTLLFNVTANDNGVTGDGSMFFPNLMIMVVSIGIFFSLRGSYSQWTLP